ncbi:MAG TPA: lasso peptide biosynthesis B2 protein [Acidimicrobiales bacterium]|nr:lasso peptide biosynthesis B2 protein [Acidimicrobiales bacterium]
MASAGASGSRLVLAIEVLRAYRRAKPVLDEDDLPAALAHARRGADPVVGDGGLAYQDALRIARAVVRTLDALPFADRRCLTQSIVLLELLAGRRTHGVLVIGVRPGDEHEDFGAHSWVELRGRPLLPTHGDDFVRLVEL